MSQQANRNTVMDNMRGWAAMFVMLVHIPERLPLLEKFYTPIMLPVFFILAGYFLQIDKYNSQIVFLRKKILPLFLSWIIISYVHYLANLSTITAFIKDYTTIWSVLKNATYNIVIGNSIWFVPCLLMSLIISFIIMKLCRNHTLLSLLIGTMISALTYYLLVFDQKLPWSINTAMINSIFVLLGVAIRKHDWLPKNTYIKPLTIPLWMCGYILILATLNFANLYGICDVRNNDCHFLPAHFLAAIFGFYMLYVVCCSLSIPLIRFMGTTSLFYFAFGAHGYRVGYMVVHGIQSIFNASWLHNPYFETLLVVTISAIFVAIFAKIAQVYFPYLNGKLALGKLFEKKSPKEPKVN